jgi:hypothetical protein
MQLKSFKKPKKILIMLWARKFNPLINLKKKKNKQKPKSAVENRPAKIKLSQTTKSQQIPPSGASEKKPAITRKPIIITKNEAKNSIFSFDCGTLFSCDKRVFDEYKSVGSAWNKDSIVTFDLPELDSTKRYDLFINLGITIINTISFDCVC